MVERESLERGKGDARALLIDGIGTDSEIDLGGQNWFAPSDDVVFILFEAGPSFDDPTRDLR